MKISPVARRGFTLIELLTVIAIIAILMGLLFPAIGSVKETARKAQAKNDAMQIVNAVKAYYTEYGKYPLLEEVKSTGKYTDTNNQKLLNILRVPTGQAADELAMNPRKIVFLEVPPAKGASGGQRAGIGSDGKYLDPWGGAYRIWIDHDYNNKVENPYPSDGSEIDTGVIAFSLGKNGKGGTGSKKSADSEDDVISWQ